VGVAEAQEESAGELQGVAVLQALKEGKELGEKEEVALAVGVAR
jgi:hypothetical protein